jgi:plastocyanin
MMYNAAVLGFMIVLSVIAIALVQAKDASAAEYTVEIPLGSQNMSCNPAYQPTGDWTKMLSDKCYNPATLKVPVNSKVTWVNKDTASHTVTYAKNPLDATTWDLDGKTLFGMKLIMPNQSVSWEFKEQGEYPYFCAVHPWMIGRVIVEAGAEPPTPSPTMLMLKTDNNSTSIEVNLNVGTVSDGMITIDPPQKVRFEVKFTDPMSNKAIEHVNYNFKVVDANGNVVFMEDEKHTHEGKDSIEVEFKDTGAYSVQIEVLGTGINKPFDRKYSGNANASISVVPEFPVGILATLAGVAGASIAMSRLRKV